MLKLIIIVLFRFNFSIFSQANWDVWYFNSFSFCFYITCIFWCISIIYIQDTYFASYGFWVKFEYAERWIHQSWRSIEAEFKNICPDSIKITHSWWHQGGWFSEILLSLLLLSIIFQQWLCQMIWKKLIH